MKKMVSAIFCKITEILYFEMRRIEYSERILINQGRILTNQRTNEPTDQLIDIKDREFSIFSQFGEDGIIQFLVNSIGRAQDIH